MARESSRSLQDLIDEENAAALTSTDGGSSSSPNTKRSAATSQYVGKSLGVPSPNIRHSSIAGEGVGVTDLNQPRRKKEKKLDPSDPSTWTRPHATSSNENRPRASSDIQRSTFEPDDGDTTSNNRDSPIDFKSRIQPLSSQRPEANTTLDPVPESAATSQNGTAAQMSGHAASTVSPDSMQAQGKATTTSSKGLSIAALDNEDNRRFSNQSASFSTVTSDSDGIGRVSRDDGKNDEEALEESSGESERFSSDEDTTSPVSERGRKSKSNRRSRSPSPESKKNKSLTTPEIKVDDTSGPTENQPHPHPPDHPGKLSETKSEKITPRSNFNRGRSPAAVSPLGDDESELKRAKELELRVSPLDETIPDRTVKMIIRGDWNAYQNYEDEEQEVRHEPRLYLVCTDLSHEATYALEWTVGTLLKDGDTILIISASEDEAAPKDQHFEEPSLEIKLESAKAADEANKTMDTLTRQTTNQESDNTYEEKKKLKVAALKEHTRSLSKTGRAWTMLEEQRVKAIDKVETDFLRFVRKTTLQVRCMVEVIHCRSPRHLILNAIDTLEPTLVVVGTRGLGTVKNVVMGSFSNYLVQKSSVPVMVARKRLKKPHHAKISSQQIRMTNNLTSFSLTGKRKSLTQARID